MKMKAAVCYEYKTPLVIEEIDIAEPRTGQVQVKLVACAICHSDIYYAEGAWGSPLPHVAGHEAAGIVTKVGDGVTNAQIGDHVIATLIRYCGQCYYCTKGNHQHCEGAFPNDAHPHLSKDGTPITSGMNSGGFAEYMNVDQSQVAQIPRNMAFENASLLACGVITGFGAVVNTAQMPSGSSAVIIGAGGVGLNAIQGAAISGAQPVIAIDLLDSKLKVAKEFGATHAVNGKKEDSVAAVKAATQGRGADYVFVSVGSAKAFEQAIDMLNPGGTVVLVGMPASGAKSVIEAVNLAYYGHKLIGSNMGSTKLKTDIPKLIELYEQGRLKLDELVTKTYPLEEINEAIAAVHRGEALRNVIVFD